METLSRGGGGTFFDGDSEHCPLFDFTWVGQHVLVRLPQVIDGATVFLCDAIDRVFLLSLVFHVGHDLVINRLFQSSAACGAFCCGGSLWCLSGCGYFQF